MDKERLGELLTHYLGKYNFKNYGAKLFYLDLKDSIIILEVSSYNGACELYLNLIIKECHPEINKITKSILKDDMLIDTFTYNKLLYHTPKGYRWDFLDIDEKKFEKTIDRFYKENIKKFEEDVITGIEHFNKLYYKIDRGHQIQLYKDSAEKIGHTEFAGFRGHDYLLSDCYRLVNEYMVDSMFVKPNTEKYIMENVIKNVPKELKGKELAKWCNEKCKEIFIAKNKWRSFGWLSIFPFVDGKPLKFYGTKRENNKAIQIYINEETNDLYHCVITDRSNSLDVKYEIYKVN